MSFEDRTIIFITPTYIFIKNVTMHFCPRNQFMKLGSLRGIRRVILRKTFVLRVFFKLVVKIEGRKFDAHKTLVASDFIDGNEFIVAIFFFCAFIVDTMDKFKIALLSLRAKSS